jgi:membrane protein
LTDQLDHLASTPHVQLGWTFAISFLLSIWSSNAGMKSLIAGLNVAYEVKEHRNFFLLNAISLGLTLGLILVALAVAAFLAWLSLIGLTQSLWALAIQWVVMMGVIFLGLSVLYSYGPCRPRSAWRCITPGSAFSAVTWLVVSLLFTLYVANFGHYDRTYGALGAIVGFMTWIWLSLCVVLVGAELNSNVR